MVTSGKTFANARVDELIVSSAGATITDREWREHCEQLRTLARLGTPARAMVIFGVGNGPDARQRQVLADDYKDVGLLKVALLTDSTLARGALTAIGWLMNAAPKAYGHSELDPALTWLATFAKFNAAQARSTLVEVIRLTGGDPSALG
jgi:hypothetical protein